ncbi:MerR family transcriptional regulator [Streptomyces sp. TRM 70361]|uniref:MerR family transcriptional regulator n=1 Tax=Streptomyces sp. TRM 70361 TaxID=3116553 RepID=UPI002E7B96F1|nr:MerR family transcriptional regulator [Streptomyces sp. TRM 70361]MEE1938454.1 MerR family transcriptional regulator [Streptomyces sp. TRM 70361]
MAEHPGPSPAGLSTGAVARRLGVSSTTLRSWDRRYGLGPTGRTDGRHRRWSPRDVAVLELMCRLTASGVPPAEAARQARAPGSPPTPAPAPEPPPEPLPAAPPPRTGGGNTLPVGSGAGPECRGLARAAVRLDAPALDRLLDRAIAEHGVVGAWEEVITPALRAAGRKWAASNDTTADTSDGAAGERYAEVEHLLSWHVSSALRRVTARPRPGPEPSPAPGPPLLLACAPGETHTLPLEVLTAALNERGLPVRMFGAAVPPGALEEAVRRTGPAAVVLWSQTRRTADAVLVRRIRTLAWGVRGARLRPAVLAAGPGWRGTRLTGAVRPRGLRDALDVLTAAGGP